MMDWGAPNNFIWFWLVPAVIGIFWTSSWRKRSQMKRLGELALVERLTASFNPKKRLFKRILWIVALGFILVALCQPHFRKKEMMVERKGIDVIIAIDVSQSMLAKDISPSRLEKSKLELAGLIDRLKGHRIGIVAFAGDAVIQCPLTLDRNAAKLFLSTINPDLIPTPGTAIAKAIQTASQAFSDKEKEFKAVILLTDGEDHEGKSLEVAKRAKEQGIRIFTIGIGTPDGGTLPSGLGEGFKKDRQGQVVLSRLNESLLKEMAQTTGGVYFRSSRGEVETDRISLEISRMAQKSLKKELSVEYEESYQYLLIVAYVLLLIQWWMSERKRE